MLDIREVEDKVISILRERSNSITLEGIDDNEEYNYLMKKIFNYIENKNSIILYKGLEVPFNLELSKAIMASLETMNLNEIDREEITLSSDYYINLKVTRAIGEILSQALQIEEFRNVNVKKNFITIQLMWLYEFINKIDWNNPLKPVILIYGDLSDEEKYQMQMLEIVGVCIIYINPKSSINFKVRNPKELINFKFENTGELISLEQRIYLGKDTLEIAQEEVVADDTVTTWAKEAKEEYNNKLNSVEGFFRPWQFKHSEVKSLKIDAVIEDITTYWSQEARFRPGFKVEGDSIYVPNFMCKVNGAYSDLDKFRDLVENSKTSELTEFKDGTNIININSSKADICSLVFTMEEEMFNYEKLKEHKLYKIKNLNKDVQKYIVTKLNEFIGLYKSSISMEDLLTLASCVLSLDERYLRLIECFDFPFKIPKLVFYVKDRNTFDYINGLFVRFMDLVGLDILIFSLTGSQAFEDEVIEERVTDITLDEMKFDLEYEQLKKECKPKSLFKRIFGGI